MRKILALAAAAALASADQAGIQASLSTDGTNYLLSTIIPLIEAKISSLSIPGVSGEKDGFDYSLNAITCQGFTIGSWLVTTSAANGVAVALNDASLSCSADWSFKLHIWPHLPSGSGSVDISVSQTTANLGIDITDVTLHPQLAPTNMQLNVGSINLSFHGSLWDWLIDIFKGFIESTVKDAVEKEFGSAITDLIANDLNPKLAAIAMAYPLHVRAPYDIAEVRFGLTANPTFDTQYVGVALQGDIVPIAAPASPPIAPPNLPPFNPASAATYFQMQVSSYTFLSAVYTYYTAGVLEWLIPAAKLPAGLNSTTAYVLIAPGLPLAYPDSAMAINFAFLGQPSIAITASSGVNISAPLALEFMVDAHNGSYANAFTLGAQTTLTAELTIGPDSNGTLALMGQLEYLSANLSVVNSCVGGVSTGLLQGLIDITFRDVVIPLVNSIFGNGFPLPSVDGVALTDTELLYADGYLTLGSNFTYTPSAAVAEAPLVVRLPGRRSSLRAKTH